MTTNASAGTFREITLSQGVVRYQELGSGPTLVFIHGLIVNSALWRHVMPPLAEHFRCIAPDLPLGAHSLPMRSDADLSPLSVARLVADFLEALDLQDVTLIGNDTGGAICQLVIAHYPERIGRLVLTNCDTYEQFFPVQFRFLQYGARVFGTRFVDLLAWLLRSRATQRLLVASVSLRRLEDPVLDVFFVPLRSSRGVRNDLTRFLRSVSNRYTLEAARAFPDFRRHVLILWGKDDIFFSSENAKRLQRAFPHATLEFVSRSRAFVPEDQPEILVQRIAEFVHESVSP